jgi:hypothetical protein
MQWLPRCLLNLVVGRIYIIRQKGECAQTELSLNTWLLQSNTTIPMGWDVALYLTNQTAYHEGRWLSVQPPLAIRTMMNHYTSNHTGFAWSLNFTSVGLITFVSKSSHRPLQIVPAIVHKILRAGNREQSDFTLPGTGFARHRYLKRSIVAVLKDCRFSSLSLVRLIRYFMFFAEVGIAEHYVPQGICVFGYA